MIVVVGCFDQTDIRASPRGDNLRVKPTTGLAFIYHNVAGLFLTDTLACENCADEEERTI